MLQSDSLTEPGSRDARRFRRRFRVPFPFFKELLQVVRENKWFPTRDGDIDVAGRRIVPLELKVRERLLPHCRPLF